jgi:hypothetical protein
VPGDTLAAQSPVEPSELEDLLGVAEAIRVSQPYELVSREKVNQSSTLFVLAQLPRFFENTAKK